MKVMVTGSRALADQAVTPEWQEIKARFWMALTELNPDVLIHGGAAGPDTWAHQWADEADYLLEVVRVRPVRVSGQSFAQAAFERNLRMLDMGPDVLVACHDGVSSGTLHTINNANDRGIKIMHVKTESS